MDLQTGLSISITQVVQSEIHCHGCLQFAKSVISPLMKLLDSGLYFADIYSDIAYANLLYRNCHYKYFAMAVGTIALSYLTTVFYLVKVFHVSESWRKAAIYPIRTIRIVVRKILTFLPFIKGME